VNCKVLTLESTGSAKAAIQKCADALKRFRCGKSGHGFDASEWGGSDHDLMHRNGGDKIFRAAIALPHQTKYYDTDIAGYDRLASPVMFKILPIGNMFLPIVIFLKDYFIKEGTSVRLKPKNRQGHSRTVTLSHDLLNDMLNEFSLLWPEAKCIYEKMLP
jgi:hypothetical protein